MRKKPTIRQAEQRQLAWLLYITEAYAANLAIARKDAIAVVPKEALNGLHAEAVRSAEYLRLKLHQMYRKEAFK